MNLAFQLFLVVRWDIAMLSKTFEYMWLKDKQSQIIKLHIDLEMMSLCWCPLAHGGQWTESQPGGLAMTCVFLGHADVYLP